MSHIALIVGGGLDDDATAFVQAWRRADTGETVDDRALTFESREALAKVLSGERYRMLKHVHAHPEPSISALARSLGRHYRRVHADVTALEEAGLVARHDGILRATADTLRAEIRL